MYFNYLLIPLLRNFQLIRCVIAINLSVFVACREEELHSLRTKDTIENDEKCFLINLVSVNK